MPRPKLTTKQYISKLRRAGSTLRPLVPYAGSSTRILHRDVCGHTRNVSPKHVIDSADRACLQCLKDHSLKARKAKIEKAHGKGTFKILGEPDPVTSLCGVKHTICGHVWETKLSSLSNGHGCQRCSPRGSVRKTHEVFSKQFKAVHGSKYVLLEKYTYSMTPLLVRHKTCGTEWKASPHHLLYGHGCPSCSVTSGNFSKKAIRWIEYEATRRGLDIQHAENGGEVLIPSTRMKADGYCAKTKTVFEFYGDRFHGNPKVFKPDALCHPFVNRTARELYRATKLREKRLRSRGYKVKTMWEAKFQELVSRGALNG